MKGVEETYGSMEITEKKKGLMSGVESLGRLERKMTKNFRQQRLLSSRFAVGGNRDPQTCQVPNRLHPHFTSSCHSISKMLTHPLESTPPF